MIRRISEIKRIQQLLQRNPIAAIIGPRQVGKTTLARQLADDYEGNVHFFDLEDPGDLARLDDPMLALGNLEGLVVIDEVQRLPELFPILRVLADRSLSNTRFLILGSARPDLLQQSSETLAGRIFYHELYGFNLQETGSDTAQNLWLKGGFPRSFLASDLEASYEWRIGFIRTFLEQDLPQLGSRVNATTLRRFWTMLAHYHGQTWNSSEFARSFGIADTTIRSYVDLLCSAMVVFQLQPWFENISKRQVKAPKFYIRDSGILHTLLGLHTQEDLESHPKVGASWEGFVLQEIVRRTKALPEECYFWASHGGAELDLLIVRGNHKLGFEIKRNSSPRITRSARSSYKSLNLDRLAIVHAGTKDYPLAEGTDAIAFANLDAYIESIS